MTVPQIIVSLDGMTREQALALVADFHAKGESLDTVKIHDLYDRYGPSIIHDLFAAGASHVWVDYKLYDKPETVYFRAKALAEMGASIISVHIGDDNTRMMQYAVDGVRDSGKKALLYGVTLLTSTAAGQIDGSVEKIVLNRARLAKIAGLNGVVSSPRETALLTGQTELWGMHRIAVGIRPKGSAVMGQERYGTPTEAALARATHIVIGSPVTADPDPFEAYNAITVEMTVALIPSKLF